MTNKKSKILEAAISAAVTAGKILCDHANDVMHKAYDTKESLRDIVTPVERYAEQEIIAKLKHSLPHAAILTEESGIIRGKRQKTNYWVVDPLDGTVNYINHLPFYAVSIAFVENNKPTVGVIYNPLSNELYYGARTLGVFKNHSRITLTDKPSSNSLFAVSFSGKQYDPKNRAGEFLTMGMVNDGTMGCLRTGSAAMNLAYLSEGRLGGCWGKANKWWDIAAGILLAELAGAKINYYITDKQKNLINYMATVPSAWNFLAKQVTEDAQR